LNQGLFFNIRRLIKPFKGLWVEGELGTGSHFGLSNKTFILNPSPIALDTRHGFAIGVPRGVDSDKPVV
jgi:hypothetical protein